MNRLKRYSTTTNEEIIPVLRILNILHLLSKEDKNRLGWK